MSQRALPIATLALAALLGITGCGANTSENSSDTSASASSTAGESTLSLEDNHGTQTITKPVGNIAVTDNRSFEILDQWDVKLVAAPKPIIPSTVENYKNDDSIVDIGNHREPNLELLASAEPDLIVNGQRFAQHYDDIAKLNPDATIVEFEPRDGEKLDEELKRQTFALGKIFDKNDEAQQLVDDFDAALERAKKAYDPSKKVMAVNVSGGEIGYIAPGQGRFFGPVFDLLDFAPALEVENASDDHKGDDISVEAIAEANPDWILVLDRDAALSSVENAVPAEQVIENNTALKNVSAVKDKNLVYAPKDTYTNENIITYTETLNSLADAFEKAK